MEKRTEINKYLKAKYDAFKAECGGAFHFVIGYVMDKGFSSVLETTDDDIQAMVKQLVEEEKNSKYFMIMTPQFQGWLVEMAVKLVKIGKPFDLLKYLQNEIWMN